jgi:hypothetical protein
MVQKMKLNLSHFNTCILTQASGRSLSVTSGRFDTHKVKHILVSRGKFWILIPELTHSFHRGLDVDGTKVVVYIFSNNSPD